MTPFTETTAKDWLAAHAPVLPSDFDLTKATVEAVTTNSQVNYVFRVSVPGGHPLYIKQALDRVRTTGWEFDRNRLGYEVRALGMFAEIWGRHVVPNVLLYDPGANAALLSDVLGAGDLLSDAFARGEMHVQAARRLGELAGALHRESRQRDLRVRPEAVDDAHRVFMLRFKASWVQQHEPNAWSSLETASNAVAWAQLAWDLADKNIVVDAGDVRLFDFEGASRWDPAFELGHLVGHFVLQAWRWPDELPAVANAVALAVEAYFAADPVVHDDPREAREVRATRYVAVTLAHRALGRGRSSWITPEVSSAIEDVARRWLTGSEVCISDLAGLLRRGAM